MSEKLISVPIDHKDLSKGKFDLYYFVRMPESGKGKRTVLFCAGGPGQMVHEPMSEITFADFLTQNGYNVVYFHQRGAGLSQIPASNRYDRFLRTRYAIEDIEEIRRDFLGEHGKWDGIIGWSYGTVVAQQYTHSYRDKVERLVLIGPMSRDKFKNSGNPFDETIKAIRNIDRNTLANILKFTDFDDLSSHQKEAILDTVFMGDDKGPGIFDRAEDAFGSLQFVIESYCQLKKQNELQNYHLHMYSREFFQALRDLHVYGWPTDRVNKTEEQLRIGHRIKEEVLYSQQYRDDCSNNQEEVSSASSRRAYYAIGAYDGIDLRFLREWLNNGKTHLWDALRKSGGKANDSGNINQYLGKIGIGDNEPIEPWDPAQYQHDAPTLILKGSADTVPAMGAAEHFFQNALTGPRTSIEFLGFGHNLELPVVDFPERILTGTVELEPSTLQAGEARQLLGIYKGRNLDKRFRMELKTDGTDLHVAGFGIRGKNANGSLDILALIENKGTEPANVNSKTWKISNALFSGIVVFEDQSIDPRGVALVTGTIKEAWLTGEHAIYVRKPHDLERGLELKCVQVGEQALEIWIKNDTSSPLDGQARGWTVSKDGFSVTISVDPDLLDPQQLTNPTRWLPLDYPSYSGLRLDQRQSVDITPNKGLLGCIQEEDENKVSVIIVNPTDNDVNSSHPDLTIRNAMFSRSYSIDLLFIPKKQGIVKILKNPKYEWLMPPPLLRNPESEPELLGWNITGENEVSLLIRNNPKPLDLIPREWIYIDPNEDELSACVQTNPSRDCLIYSFLVFNSSTFSNERYNKILSMIPDIQVCYRDGNQQETRKQNSANCRSLNQTK